MRGVRSGIVLGARLLVLSIVPALLALSIRDFSIIGRVQLREDGGEWNLHVTQFLLLLLHVFRPEVIQSFGRLGFGDMGNAMRDRFARQELLPKAGHWRAIMLESGEIRI